MRSQLQKPTASSGRASSHQGRKPQRRRSSTAPEIPDKLYFRIGEVARLCAVQTYVLRFWESEFSQLKPSKSGTGQRLYRRRDVEMALKIKRLLYEEGYTIAGARQAFQLEAKSAAPKAEGSQPELPLENRSSALKVQRLKTELREILGMLSQPVGRPRLINKPRAAETRPQLFD